MYLPPITATGSVFSLLEWFGAVCVALPILQVFTPKGSLMAKWLALLSVDLPSLVEMAARKSKSKSISGPPKADSE